MEFSILRELNEERRARRAAILVSDLDGGPSRIIREGEVVEGELQAVTAAGFRTGRSGAHEVGGRRLFLAVSVPQPRLVVIGAVHISQALAPMGRIAGLAVEIIDPRTAFATPERFPDVPLSAEWPEDALRNAPLDAYCALAALTHDPKIDDFALAAALKAGCFYVGALGSRKTHAKRVERLLSIGLPQALVDAIRAPIGLDIGAASPAEIAVAVLAEVISALRARVGEGASP